LTSRAGHGAGRVESTQIDVERAVRNRLYGERSELTVAPLARTAVPARQSAELLGGRYRLLSLIGAGGMTNVYCARDELLRRHVAVKILAEPLASDPRCLRQFRREAQLWAGLVHPLIVAVFDAGAVPRPFIVMELVPGMSAGALARGPRPPPCDRAISIVAQVAEAIAFAHEHDVIHRDVSPGNVLIRRSHGAAKLTDFGLACKAGEKAGNYGGDVAGTYGYIAPEVLRGETVTALSDLYSLGALAYRLLAGPPEPRLRRLADVRPGLPAGVAEAVDRALEHDPHARQSSVAEFRAQLRPADRPAARLPRREAA
jgi:eukaryotic-like serine/threonine-protein kinase